MAEADMTFLTGFTGGNKEKMTKYINMFLSDAVPQLEKMKVDLIAQNYDGVRTIAHSIKPQITYMGIKNAEELVKKIERSAEDKSDLDKLPNMVNEFITICTTAIEELKQIIASL